MTETKDKSLEERVADLEARVPAKTPLKVNTEISLQECNAIAARAQAEIKAEKRDAAKLAKDAIDTAFRDRAGKRVQKNLSPAAMELAAKLAKK